MKKLITVSLLLICVSISFSQSKKQQIETLTIKLDSVNSVLLRSIDSNRELNTTKIALESKISLLKNENASKNDEISLKNEKIESLTKEVNSLEQDYKLVVADLNSKADSAEIFKLKKERIIEVNSYYLKIVDDYLMGAINCLTKELSEDYQFSDVKKCQLDDGFSYKKIENRNIEKGTTITEYFYKNNICFFVNRFWGSEGVSEFQRLYYDRNGQLIQVLSTQLNPADIVNYCYFYTEVIEKEKINYIIDEISSSEMKLDRIFGDK